MCVERYPLFNIHEHHGQVVSSILLKNRRSLAERSVAGKDADTEPHLGWDIGRVGGIGYILKSPVGLFLITGCPQPHYRTM